MVGTTVQAQAADRKSDFTPSSHCVKLIDELRNPVQAVVREKFGGPDWPRADERWPLDKSFARGESVFRQHCARCHGVTGDGESPAAHSQTPRPRDFRAGLFKWTSTKRRNKPTRHDLQETLRLGVPGTAMPPFDKLPVAERDSVVEYVRWLAMAGECERKLSIELLASGFSIADVAERLANGETREAIRQEVAQLLSDEFKTLVDDAIRDVMNDWQQAEHETNIVRPKTAAIPVNADSIARGKALYQNEKLKCTLCHGTGGKGDGEYTRRRWPMPGSTKKYAEEGLHDDWGYPQPVPDLTEGVYRGGGGTDDLYRRIVAGITGTAMPPYNRSLSDAEVWDLIHYVRSLRSEKPLREPTAPRRATPPSDSK
jgi:mono/diheme cytochrome c family protein